MSNPPDVQGPARPSGITRSKPRATVVDAEWLWHVYAGTKFGLGANRNVPEDALQRLVRLELVEQKTDGLVITTKGALVRARHG